MSLWDNRLGRSKFPLVFLIFLFVSTFLFSENGWIPEGLADPIKKYSSESKCLKINFETSVAVDAECLYPYLPADNSFVDYVNKRLEFCANNCFTDFVEYEKSSEEIHDNDFG